MCVQNEIASKNLPQQNGTLGDCLFKLSIFHL